MKVYSTIFILCSLIYLSCNSQTNDSQLTTPESVIKQPINEVIPFDSTINTIHIFVALCDNKYQGIVPVPPKIGNGQDLNNNLYWGCGYGIRSYFKKSKDWKLVRTEKLDSTILERLVFQSTSKNYYLIADAYNGKYIQQCTEDFLHSTSGQRKDTLHIHGKTVGIAGNSKLVAYIGHDGLMDFQLTDNFQTTDDTQRDVIILACYSKRFFSPHLDKTNTNPLVWTSGLMCPEAYTIHDALVGYMNNESNEQIRTRAASAYSKYQKCSEKAARNLLLTGW
jgi:hypothetical protein